MNQPEINMSQHKKCAEISAHRETEPNYLAGRQSFTANSKSA